jgi:hypothetical protein
MTIEDSVLRKKLPVIGSRVRRGPGGRYLNTSLCLNKRRKDFLSQVSVLDTSKETKLTKDGEVSRVPCSDERENELRGFVPTKAVVLVPKISIDHGHSRVNLNENLI